MTPGIFIPFAGLLARLERHVYAGIIIDKNSLTFQLTVCDRTHPLDWSRKVRKVSRRSGESMSKSI